MKGRTLTLNMAGTEFHPAEQPIAFLIEVKAGCKCTLSGSALKQFLV